MKINSKEYWDANIAEPKFGLRQQKYLELAGKDFRGSIIELGCGVSPFVPAARKFFQNSWGLDFSEKTIEAAEDKYGWLPDTHFIVGDAINTPFKDNDFLVSVAGELIEHLEHPEQLAKEMNRITKDKMIVSTALMEYDEPEHIQKFTKESLTKLFEPYGKVTVEEIDSKWFPGRKYLFLLCQKFSKPA